MFFTVYSLISLKKLYITISERSTEPCTSVCLPHAPAVIWPRFHLFPTTFSHSLLPCEFSYSDIQWEELPYIEIVQVTDWLWSVSDSIWILWQLINLQIAAVFGWSTQWRLSGSILAKYFTKTEKHPLGMLRNKGRGVWWKSKECSSKSPLDIGIHWMTCLCFNISWRLVWYLVITPHLV